MKHTYRWSTLLGLLVLTACGGGHSSSGSGSGGTTPPPQAYTIGGTISDLTAAGLQLQDNGADTISPQSGATTFSFPTALSSGSGYDVTVSANPSGETCTVANYQGTATANITNVEVTCTANTPPVTYTIGGTIEGLTASGLVLLDNGGDAYTASAGTAFSFTFATPLASGTAYDVSIQTQPAGESCQVFNGGGNATANITSVVVSCSPYASDADLALNVVPVTVESWPPSTSNINIPYVTVTVCEPSNPTTCATIDHVEVDTGSSGLRLLASALAQPDAGSKVNLSPVQVSGNALAECWSFGGAYAWGSVDTANVAIGQEKTESSIKVHVIDDNTAPTACSNGGTQWSSTTDFDANGVLGVGVLKQDCGTSCDNFSYYTCTSDDTGTCTATTLAVTDQVQNPVTALVNTNDTPDDNGVILQLPAIPDGGLTTATGYLVFGIGTETSGIDDNDIGSATILQANSGGFIETSFNGGTAVPSSFDSGTNVYLFDNNSYADLTICTSGAYATDQFYCPSSTLSLSATIYDGSGNNPVQTPFEIGDAESLTSGNNAALDDIGVYNDDSVYPFFEWGLPFFYGKSVFVGIQDAKDGTNEPNGFYAYQ